MNQLKYFKMKSKDSLKEKMLEEIFNELERQAYNQDYHNYSVKETNQIIRKYFEILITASQQCQKRDELIKAQDELIEWLDQECPSVAPPLEPYTNYDLTHDFCDSLRMRLDKIEQLKKEI